MVQSKHDKPGILYGNPRLKQTSHETKTANKTQYYRSKAIRKNIQWLRVLIKGTLLISICRRNHSKRMDLQQTGFPREAYETITRSLIL